jgi:hypothetical protein
MYRRILAMIVVVALAPAVAGAGIDKAGTTAGNFLAIGAGPSVLAMGGAGLARYGTLENSNWNVGALGWLPGGAITLSHATLDDETTQEWASFGGRIAKTGTRWAANGLYQSEGAFEGRDASNQPTGSFNVSGLALGGTIAQPIGQHVSIGFGGRGVMESYGALMRGAGLAFDAGLSLRFGALGFGAAAQNVGNMRFSDQKYSFPTNYGAGLSYAHAPSGLTAVLDVNVPDAYYPDARAGVEWQWKNLVALRAGYRAEIGAETGESLGGPTFGMGAGAHGFWVDYGFLSGGLEGGQHRFALTLHPGAMGMPGDPFGQNSMPKEFPASAIGPPPPGARTK